MNAVGTGPCGPGRGAGPWDLRRSGTAAGANGPTGPGGPEDGLRRYMRQLRDELTEEDVVRIWREVLVGNVMDE
jgi:hypothetical protein